MEEERDLTLVIGSSMDLHNVPPPPASQARTWGSALLVSGAEASQNGLRHGMPQKVVASVGLSSGKFGLQPRGNADARAFSVCYCIHYFAAAIGTVAAGEELGV